MIEQDFLTELGLDTDTAQALAELIAEEVAAAGEQLAQTLCQPKAAAQRELPRMVAVTPGTDSMGQEQFAQLGYAARVQLLHQNPQRYRQLAQNR